MSMYARLTCGHEITYTGVHPSEVKCAACNRIVGVWAVSDRTAPPVTPLLQRGTNPANWPMYGYDEDATGAP